MVDSTEYEDLKPGRHRLPPGWRVQADGDRQYVVVDEVETQRKVCDVRVPIKLDIESIFGDERTTVHAVSIEGTKVHPVRIKRPFSATHVTPGGLLRENAENRLCVAAGICATVCKTSIQDDSALNVLTITLQRAFARMGWAQPTIALINEAMKVEWSRMLQDEPAEAA